MDGTAGQLTNTGLEQLDKLLEPGLPSILFRNNHFLTIVKKNGRIWALVTDQGYMESEVVWESLDIGGDSEFVDGYFLPLNSQSIAPQYLNDESSEGFRFASTTTMSSREQREKGKKPKKQSECIIQ